MRNKYYDLLAKVLVEGKTQENKKGNIKYLLNEQLSLTPGDLPLKSITLNLGNVHIYEINLEKSRLLIEGCENIKFELNV